METKKIKLAIWIGLPVFVISLVLVFINPLQTVQWKVSDLFFQPKTPSDLITIIAIDDKSLSPEVGLGRFKDWPRSYFAQLLRSLNTHKPAVTAFDLDFREISRGMSQLRVQQVLREYERRLSSSPAGVSFDWYKLLKDFDPSGEGGDMHPDDADFLAAIKESGKVILNSSLVFSGGTADLSTKFPEYTNVILPIFKAENITVGFNNIIPDRDGIVRRFMPQVSQMQFFPLAIADAFLNKSPEISEPEISENAPAQELIRYFVKPNSYRTISFVDAVAGKFDPAAIAGKIVLVGGTSRILQDIRSTPVSKNPMAGVEINANIIQQILEGKTAQEQGRLSLIILIFIFAFGGAAAFLKLNPKYLGIIFGLVLFGFPIAAFGTYQSGIVLNIVYPETAWILTAVAALWYRNKTEFREKKMLQNAFAHYVSPVVVKEIVKNPHRLHLGGSRKQISVLFSDIVGFTTLAEKLSPEDTVALLNDYLTAMTNVIFEFHGTLDKYQGDAIMALFGAPIDDDAHAINACRTALDMRKALTILHEKWNAIPHLPFKEQLVQLDFRVGVSTGQAVIGNIGSEKRFDYTAIGDIVNLGSRLESINRQYGTHVIVDKNTFVAITENHNPFIFRKLDKVRVKGKKQETEIFEVITLAETATSDLKSMLDDFESGRILYLQRNFAEAKQYFQSVLSKFPQDGPAQIFKNRCDYFMRKPPRRDWDGIVDVEEK